MFAPQALTGFYDAAHKAMPMTKNGGSVGDARHVRGGGYHISPKLLYANRMGGDYSLVSPRDAKIPHDDDAVSANDLTFTSATEMRAACRRLMGACQAGKLDGSALREWFGTLDSKTVTGFSPYRHRIVTSSDISHLWHIHFSWFRDSNRLLPQMLDVLRYVAPAISVPAPPVIVKPLPPAVPDLYTPRFPDDRVMYVSKLDPGVKDSDSVWWAQQMLNVLVLDHVEPLQLTGYYDTPTEIVVRQFQKQICNDKPDGDLGPIQSRYLRDCAAKSNARLGSVTVKDRP